METNVMDERIEFFKNLNLPEKFNFSKELIEKYGGRGNLFDLSIQTYAEKKMYEEGIFEDKVTICDFELAMIGLYSINPVNKIKYIDVETIEKTLEFLSYFKNVKYYIDVTPILEMCNKIIELSKMFNDGKGKFKVKYNKQCELCEGQGIIYINNEETQCPYCEGFGNKPEIEERDFNEYFVKEVFNRFDFDDSEYNNCFDKFKDILMYKRQVFRLLYIRSRNKFE